MDEIRMTCDQAIVTRDVGLSGERRAEALVKLCDLLEGEVFKLKACADVEGRLVRIGDEEMRLGRIDDGERQTLPRRSRIERALVVPRAKETKDLAAELAREQTINLIHCPDERCRQTAQHVPAHVAREVDARAALRIPLFFGRHGQVELIADQLRERLKERLD